MAEHTHSSNIHILSQTKRLKNVPVAKIMVYFKWKQEYIYWERNSEEWQKLHCIIL